MVQGAVHAAKLIMAAIDLNPNRLNLARQFGATHTIQAEQDDAGLLRAAEKVRGLTGRRADYAFECTAVPALGLRRWPWSVTADAPWL